jgi:ABC transport system ATP-binding/permease protein
VTHDRYLLDRVSTRVLALDGRGGAVPYADYDQWEAGQRAAAQDPARAKPADRPAAPSASASAGPKKLGYLDQREWDEMEARILEVEGRLEACRSSAADPAVARDHVELQRRLDALTDVQAEVDRLYARWAELEAKARGEAGG